MRRQLITALGIVAVVAGCTSSDKADTTVTVASTADECVLSTSTAPAGKIAFDVRNDASEATEFYIYAEDGTTVKGEVENIGPGLIRTLTADLEAGTYVAACKPGMTGDGIRSDFTVTDG